MREAPADGEPHSVPEARLVRVAAVQLESANGDITGNLARATTFVEQAAGEGAKLILLPEFLAAGYAWTKTLWQAAEPEAGPTADWLGETSRRLGVWLGTSFLEANGSDFYNTFVLAAPDGSEAGRVRKQHPALWEAFFTRGEGGPHVIDTSIGRIGVGICYENYLAFLPRLMQRQSVDLLLMPHSAPSLVETFPIVRDTALSFLDELRSVGAHYAQLLGIPVVMANKCGAWHSDLPFRKPARFPGGSAIVDSDGAIKAQLGDEERTIVADVLLDPARKRTALPPTYGRWVRRVPFWRDVACWLPETAGRLCYTLSAERRKRARAISSRR